MALTAKQCEDVLWYWKYMQDFANAASLVGKRYVLDVDMRKFLTEVENPRVAKLLSEFIKAKEKDFG